VPRYVKGQRQPGQGGRRNPPGGRPTREQAEIKKEAAEIKKEAAQIAKEFIETHVQGFLDSYLDLGTGKVIEQKNKAGKTVKVKFIPADPATVRHAIDKILPDEQMESPPVYQINFLQFVSGLSQPLPIAQKPGEGLPSPEPFEREPYEGVVPEAPPLHFLTFSNHGNGKGRK
jgi:hypothetical protein